MYPVLVKITFWDEVEEKKNKAVHLLMARNYTEAVEQLESFYGNQICKIHISMYEEGLATFPVEMYDQLNKILEDNL